MVKKCPTCGYDNREDALLCNLCGMIFRKAANANPEAGEAPKAETPAPAALPPAEPSAPPPVEPNAGAEPLAGTALEWNDRGAAHFKEQKFDEALSCFEKALALAPRFVKARANKANSLFQLGYREEGIRLQEEALALAPCFLESWFNRAAMEKLMGRTSAALRSLQEFLRLAGASHQNLVSRAQRMAEELEQSGVEPAPRGALGWLSEGASHAERRDFQQAAGCFDQALSLDARLATAWLLKGNFLLQAAGAADALVCYDAGLDSDLEDARLWHGKGMALAKLQRLEEAVLSLEKATALAPKAAIPWFHKALAEERLKRGTDAAGSYQRFLELASPDMTPQIQAARERIAALSAPGNDLVTASTVAQDSSSTPSPMASRLT